MRKGGGCKKGSAFERLMSVQLSEWWTEGKEDDVFYRTHGSGSRATSRAKKGKTLRGQIGDIAATDIRGRKFTQCFVVSLKTGYKTVNIQDLVDRLENRKDPVLLEWILECEEHAIQAKSLEWMLIVKRNQRKPIVFLPGKIKFRFDLKQKKEFEKIKPMISVVAKLQKKRVMSIICITLESFLEFFDRKMIKTMVISDEGK